LEPQELVERKRERQSRTLFFRVIALALLAITLIRARQARYGA
jgi:hypothetical protein